MTLLLVWTVYFKVAKQQIALFFSAYVTSKHAEEDVQESSYQFYFSEFPTSKHREFFTLNALTDNPKTAFLHEKQQ